MKVIAINGSPRKSGNTSLILGKVTAELEKEGIETETIQIGGQSVRGCLSCGTCFKNKNNECVMKDDIINECVAKMIPADGILLGSPTYFTDVTSEMKAFIDRTGFISMANGVFLKRKAAAAVVAVRRGGATHAFNTMNHYFLINQMLVVGGNYWNMVYGLKPGEAANDDEGIENMKVIGQNMAWLLKKIK
ncbi:MAG: flavodoxin family protein [Sporomusaceae bacterium]|jgi:multimeric flavodoxin WrbA|nr:flavodoxin family protein [Sporomusaceae bacterium]